MLNGNAWGDRRRREAMLAWRTDLTEHPTREGKLDCCVVLRSANAGFRRELLAVTA
jgi:hypothetical protein